MVERNTRYDFYYLKNSDWVFFGSSHDIEEIYQYVLVFAKIRPEKYMRIDKNNVTLVFLKGEDNSVKYFKDYYVSKKHLYHEYIIDNLGNVGKVHNKKRIKNKKNNQM